MPRELFGWALDALRFLILIFVSQPVARRNSTPTCTSRSRSPRRSRCVRRRVIFGWMRTATSRIRDDRRSFFINRRVLSGPRAEYGWFRAMRALNGISVGGEWGVGASIASGSCSATMRGVFSGLCRRLRGRPTCLRRPLLLRLPALRDGARCRFRWRAARLTIYIAPRCRSPKHGSDATRQSERLARRCAANWKWFITLRLMTRMKFRLAWHAAYPPSRKRAALTPARLRLSP